MFGITFLQISGEKIPDDIFDGITIDRSSTFYDLKFKLMVKYKKSHKFIKDDNIISHDKLISKYDNDTLQIIIDENYELLPWIDINKINWSNISLNLFTIELLKEYIKLKV